MPATFVLLALLAQASAPAANDPQAKTKAQALLKEGAALYKGGELTGALEKFEAAYRMYPSPKLLFNIGQTNRDLGRPVEALTAFESFLANANDGTPELVAEARQSAVELAARLGRIRIACATTGAQATLDGKAVGTAPIDKLFWVVPGPHQVTLRHPTYQPVIAEVTVAAGETQAVQRTLSPANAAAPAPPAASPEPVVSVSTSGPTPDQGAGFWSRRRWPFWAAAGATVAFSAGAIAAGLSANSRHDELQSTCGQTRDCTDSQIDSLKSRALLTNVLWILAGASAVATGVAVFFDGRDAGVSMALRF